MPTSRTPAAAACCRRLSCARRRPRRCGGTDIQQVIVAARARRAEPALSSPPACARSRCPSTAVQRCLQLVELPIPQPADGEVLVRVTRAGLNFADTHKRTNSYLAKDVLPLVPGIEVAGVREDTGERVVALCGDGGYAEYATAPAALTFAIPDGVSDEIALALLVQGLTAWHLYRTCGRVAAGDSVVVHSAAGGVGSLAVQLGRPMGAGRVIATASTRRQARAGARARCRRGGRRGARRPDRAARRGEPRQARRRRLRDGRRRGLRAIDGRARAVRAARDLRHRVGRAEQRPQRRAHAPLALGRRLLDHALPRAAGDDRRGAGGPVRARRPRRAARRRGPRLPARARRPGRSAIWPSVVRPGKVTLDPSA